MKGGFFDDEMLASPEKSQKAVRNCAQKNGNSE